MLTAQEIKDVYVPLITALVSLVSVVIALVALYYSRQDRREQQRAAEADAKRREQNALLESLLGEKEIVGFTALQLARTPELVGKGNRDRLLYALCLAFVFESSSRARALVVRALDELSIVYKVEICKILQQIKMDFEKYEEDIGPDELTKYLKRIQKLTERLGDTATKEDLKNA